MPSATLVINVYNMAPKLALCLATVAAQRSRDFEIVIADDGSADDTPAVVSAFVAAHRDLPLRHVWHEDCGFWRTGILNAAFVAAATDYVIVVDGDMLLHPDFVGAHLRYRRADRALAGYRGVKLLPPLAAQLLAGADCYSPSAWWLLRHALAGHVEHASRALPVHARALRGLLGRDSGRLSGCNFSMYRSVLERVNGMDSSIREYGYEDFELGHRLGLVGVSIFDVSRRAITYHLEHPKSQVAGVAGKKAVLAANREPRCRSGMVELETGSSAAELIAAASARS